MDNSEPIYNPGGQLNNMFDAVSAAAATVSQMEQMTSLGIEQMLQLESAIQMEAITVQTLSNIMAALYQMANSVANNITTR